MKMRSIFFVWKMCTVLVCQCMIFLEFSISRKFLSLKYRVIALIDNTKDEK